MQEAYDFHRILTVTMLHVYHDAMSAPSVLVLVEYRLCRLSMRLSAVPFLTVYTEKVLL